MNKKLGYYLCDGREFESKVQCYLYASQNNKDVQWIFNNGALANYDFSQEPSETLDALYDRRAREIREKYDYVVLSYSGGSDSHNILMSFYRQGLHGAIKNNDIEAGWLAGLDEGLNNGL